jgi:hypothetical protein
VRRSPSALFRAIYMTSAGKGTQSRQIHDRVETKCAHKLWAAAAFFGTVMVNGRGSRHAGSWTAFRRQSSRGSAQASRAAAVATAAGYRRKPYRRHSAPAVTGITFGKFDCRS